MEIEILTTSKKLTTSLIKQMPLASSADILAAVDNPRMVLGWIAGQPFAGAKSVNLALIKGITDWRLLPMIAPAVSQYSEQYAVDSVKYIYDWRTKFVVKQTFDTHRSISHNFYSQKVRDEIVEGMKTIIRLAKGNHIYL